MGNRIGIFTPMRFLLLHMPNIAPSIMSANFVKTRFREIRFTSADFIRWSGEQLNRPSLNSNGFVYVLKRVWDKLIYFEEHAAVPAWVILSNNVFNRTDLDIESNTLLDIIYSNFNYNVKNNC